MNGEEVFIGGVTRSWLRARSQNERYAVWKRAKSLHSAEGNHLARAIELLGLPYAEVFRPLYGPDSARRFEAHVLDLALDFEALALPNLVADVDTFADLERLGPRGGVRTRALVEAIVR